MYPGINTYYVHYAELYDSSKILLYLLSQRWKEQVEKDSGKVILDNFDGGFAEIDKKLITPFILTMYSFLECLLSELEDNVDKSKFNLPYSREKRPEITERIGVLHKLLTNKTIDKSTNSFADYKYAIKIRNLMTHASGEQITWSSIDIAPIDVQVGANEYHYNKEDFIKCGFEGHIFRNKEADKIIRHLAGKKLVPAFWQGRFQGWLHYLSLPPVANWFFFSIINIVTPTLLELAKSDDTSIKQFGKDALIKMYDKEISQRDFDEMNQQK